MRICVGYMSIDMLIRIDALLSACRIISSWLSRMYINILIDGMNKSKPPRQRCSGQMIRTYLLCRLFLFFELMRRRLKAGERSMPSQAKIRTHNVRSVPRFPFVRPGPASGTFRGRQCAHGWMQTHHAGTGESCLFLSYTKPIPPHRGHVGDYLSVNTRVT